jgi:tetratricopeptide (TPR) repeat protein
MTSADPIGPSSKSFWRVTIGLFCLVVLNIALASRDDVSRADETGMIAKYEAAKADGDEAAAVRHVLDYSKEAFGENDPATIKLMHHYGHVLYQSGEYREATQVLKEALERSIAVFGESGEEAYQLNMNIAYAYSQWSPSLSNRTRHFDRALEILRETGQHESTEYVTTLVNIIVNLMEYFASMEHEYRNYFHIAEKYVLEAVELSEKLESLDEYLLAKIAIIQAKLKVMETADLAAVPMGVYGYISGGTAKELYEREEARLATAIEKLSRDIDQNEIFLTAANKVRMEIAWLSKDESRMASMCTDGVLNSASDYSPDRLYEVTEGGMVLAPGLSTSISRNLFRPVRVRKDSRGNPIKRPHFIPVCIDGRLMAALTHVPRVTVEEVR